MRKQTKHAVRRVLREARRKPDFFDHSDAERMVWMIGRGFELGLRHSPKTADAVSVPVRRGRQMR